jgi:hypothetical protein
MQTTPINHHCSTTASLSIHHLIANANSFIIIGVPTYSDFIGSLLDKIWFVKRIDGSWSDLTLRVTSYHHVVHLVKLDPEEGLQQ